MLVLLHKDGDNEEVGNYRGIEVLLGKGISESDGE